MLDDKDIIKIISAFENSLDVKLDKKLHEQSELFELKLEKKGLVWAEKTVKEVLIRIGLDVDEYKEIQSDLIFLHWLRVMCTNALTKSIIAVSSVGAIAFLVEYVKSKGYK